MKLEISIFSISAIMLLITLYCVLSFGTFDLGLTHKYECAGKSQFLGCKQ